MESYMRYDFFMIWGNGVQHVSGIVDMIREDKNFDIIRISSFEIGNMNQFINKVYECDSVPMNHLVNKTRYLLKSPNKCVFVLVKNKNPREEYCGVGNFRHIQCLNVNLLKKKIRNKYNPPFPNIKRQVPPLDTGVSHEHCIHASDYESQVEHMLKMLNLGNIEYYNRYNNLEYNFPFHLNFREYDLDDVNLNSLKMSVLNQNGTPIVMSIEESPHYQYVLGNKEPYFNYFNSFFGKQLQEDHFPKNFDKLIGNFDINYKSEDGKESYIIVGANNVIKDGAHRACIMKSLNMDQVKCIRIL
jgi:hypothetical protein